MGRRTERTWNCRFTAAGLSWASLQPPAAPGPEAPHRRSQQPRSPFLSRHIGFGLGRLRYRGNGAGALASLRTAALNLLRLAGFQSIRGAMKAVMHDTKALLEMAMRQPEHETCRYSE
jgi:hypothetical protein